MTGNIWSMTLNPSQPTDSVTFNDGGIEIC